MTPEGRGIRAASRQHRPGRPVAALLMCVVVASCGASVPSGPSSAVTPGTWGGDHVAMMVTTGGAHLEFDCAHGDIAMSLLRDADGAFSVSGVFVREHGGPIREGEAIDSHPALYLGAVERTRMTLTVRVTDTAETLGAFTLEYGAAGRVTKCL